MKALKQFFVILIIANLFSCKDTTIEKSVISETITEIRNDIEKVEPPNWWIGFKNHNLQLLVKHPHIGTAIPKIAYEGVRLIKYHKADSPNYLFLDIEILESAKAGHFDITFQRNDGSELIYTYELKSREKPAEDYIGFDSSDAIYLITPDRFANANSKNDEQKGLLQQGIDRSDGYARHGGDLKGIIEHLDYIEDLGFTAVWPSPVLTNDMPQGSYHGYAITDFYKVDPRFGTIEEYRQLADNLSARNMKLIMDQVANHCGIEHWWIKDLPFRDWINFQDDYEKNKDNWNAENTTISNHRRTTNQDPYASQIDHRMMTDGWFVPEMPDLNQHNPFMANYIIQNSIWWVETLGLDGIRQDTYPYSDKEFMSQWAGAIMAEYPNFSIVGEEWSYNPLLIGYWQNGQKNKDNYVSNLKSTMDFAMQKNIVEGLNEEESWDNGLVKMYEGLANDFAYASPKDIMAFLDNHDKSRVFTEFKGDVAKTKMALSYLLVLPRIPQIYYGTEILMNDFDNPGDHGLIRTDFPGGWEGDSVNAFTGEGLSEAQKEVQSYLKKILNYRKTSDAIHNGNTVHFAPQDGVYLLARIAANETLVHIINKNDNPQELDVSRFKELKINGKILKNIISDELIIWNTSIKLDPKTSVILTTKK